MPMCFLGATLQGGHIRSGLFLGECEAADGFAAQQPWHDPLDLLRVRKDLEALGDQSAVHCQEASTVATDRADFLVSYDQLQGGPANPADTAPATAKCPGASRS